MKTTLPTRSEAFKIYDAPNTTYKQVYFNYKRFDKTCDKILELGDFIACKDGVPLEEPPYNHKQWTIKNTEYEQAKNRVIFKGFEPDSDNYRQRYFQINYKNIELYFDKETGEHTLNQSISDLCEKVDLTDKEFKRLGL